MRAVNRSTLGKAGIVAALALAIGAVVVVKHLGGRSSEGTSPVSDAPAVTAAGLPRLVDLGAGKCVACKMMAPILEALKRDYAGRMEVVFIDVWEHPGAAEKYGVKLIPTQIFYGPSGEELFRHQGFFSREDILGKWREFGFTFPTPSVSDSGAGAE
jgi:thioredoxin 1